MEAKKIVFKINGDPDKDLQEVFENPSSVTENTYHIYMKSVEQAVHMLSPERLKLLLHMSDELGECPDVQQLSHQTKRKQEAISRDLKILEKNGLITKIKKGKHVYSKLNAKEIVIRLG